MFLKPALLQFVEKLWKLLTFTVIVMISRRQGSENGKRTAEKGISAVH